MEVGTTNDPLWAATAPTSTAPTSAASTSTGAPVTEATPVGGIAPIPVPPRPAPARRPPGRRRVTPLRVVALLVAVVTGYLVVSVLQVWSTGGSSQAREVDAIVVLGAAQYDGRPSPQLAARLDEVVRLWPEGYAPVVVVTGGRQPGDRFTEAEASAQYLIDRGIPESALLLENEGANTFDSLRSTADLLAARGADRVLLVTDPFHSLRSRLIAEEVGLEAYVAPTTSSVIAGGQNVTLHLKEALGVAAGRLIGFERLTSLTG